MAIPVLESSASATALATTTLTINKPTGLAEGDLLLAQVASADIGGANGTWNTPSGWTLIQSGGTTNDSIPAAFYKVATSSDVAASNFTFTLNIASTAVSGGLMRISGFNTGAPIGASEIDQATGSVTTMTHTTSLTPTITNSLLIFAFAGAGNNFTFGAPSIASYASTPTATWSEVVDAGATNASLDGHGFSIAQADYTGTTTITSRQAVISETSNSGYSSIAIVVSGTVDASGTNALLEVQPTTFTQNGSAGTLGTNALHEVSPTLNDANGTSFNPTTWTTTPKS